MSRRILIPCNFCGDERPAAETGGWADWRGLDACSTCLSVSKPLSEVLEVLRQMTGADGMYVSAADIIPPQTRPRAKPGK